MKLNLIAKIENRLGQFSESTPFILVVQKNNGEHITADNFSSSRNEVALTSVLETIISKYLPHQSISLTDLIKATRKLEGAEKFDRHLMPEWTENEHVFQRFDIVDHVRVIYHASVFDLESMIASGEIKSFLLCLNPNSQNIFCRIAEEKDDPTYKLNLVAVMLLDYARYYDFDPVLLLQNLQLVAQL